MSPGEARQTILVIDDTPDTVKILKKQLEYWGYRALTATSGEAGLQVLDTEHPDLILLDILMPKMKGREVCAHLKANPQTKDIPVMFLTSLSLPDHIKTGLELGAEDYIVKPFQPDDLKARIQTCLARHQNPQPPSTT